MQAQREAFVKNLYKSNNYDYKMQTFLTLQQHSVSKIQKSILIIRTPEMFA